MFARLRTRFSGALVRRIAARAQSVYDAGDLEETKRCCRAILKLAPADAFALRLLAAVAADERRGGEGLYFARRAIAANPQDAAAHYVMGRLLEAAGRLEEAEASYRRAIALDSEHARAHTNLGCVLHRLGRLEEALACYRRALALDPDQPEANQNYAAIVRDEAAQQRAIEGYRRRIEAHPQDAEIWHNLANTLAEIGRIAEALAAYARAVELAPERAEFHFARALALLLAGEYAEGFREYEWRLKLPALAPLVQRFPQPLWEGERISGAVLIRNEQGFGDLLQMARYLPLVAERCGAVVLECPTPLAPLLAGVEGVARVVAHGEPLPDFAAQLPAMSLPRVFGTTLETIPWRGAYLRAPADRLGEWRERIGPEANVRLRVGLVWAGNPENWDDRKRSLALAELAPLARLEGVVFYSLQKGAAAAQAQSPPVGMRLIDHGEHIRDFADTAALASLLDGVVTVDTSVAHLAGALGARTHVLLARVPAWRYHLERDDCPWYPSMRLFRQQRDGDWSAPVAAVADELQRLARDR